MLEMEHVHGIDVSWMTHGSPKDKPPSSARESSVSTNSNHRESLHSQKSLSSNEINNKEEVDPTQNSQNAAPSPSRPGFIRSNSSEKTSQNGNMQRRSSWFSNISSKFTSSSTPIASTHQAEAIPPSQNPPIPKIVPAKNAVLQHAARVEGDGPYTPAPPRNAGFLGVFRRLSSTAASGNSQTLRGNHGLVDRVVLNVDNHRERCKIKELNQAKLRRVAFCVDVEIAPMPKYAEPAPVRKPSAPKKKMVEKGEAEALKHPDAVREQKEHDGIVAATGEIVPKEPEHEGRQAETTETLEPPSEPKREANLKKKRKKKEKRRGKKGS